MKPNPFLPALVGALLLSAPAAAETVPTFVGDSTNGQRLYANYCSSCHGQGGTGGDSGVSLRDSGRMNLVRDEIMHELIQTGKGAKDPKAHTLKGSLSFLETWDVIAYVRTLHMTIADFFPESSRYLSKTYTVDKFGKERFQKATGKPLTESSAAVFTFFFFVGEEGNLRFVPQDPILLDQLKKKNKRGYLVFLPFSAQGYEGEIGIGVDKRGVIKRLAVHGGTEKAKLLNQSLAKFEGNGRLGQTEPLQVGGGKQMRAIEKAVFPAYLRAMETVTMYVRDERERTWADE